MDDAQNCHLVSSFLARQGIILLAGLLFLLWIAVRVRQGRERRDLKTFVSDVSKQGGQQALGGTMMVLLGLKLSESGYSSLAWYGAEYPFEIVLTTIFTGLFRNWVELYAGVLVRQGKQWAMPYSMFGQYGPRRGEWLRSWYAAQLFQAIFLIGFPSRVLSLAIIYLSLLLPEAISPVRGLAAAWYNSGATCEWQTVCILYIVPLLGDAVQFIIIDRLQAFGLKVGAGHGGSDARGGDDASAAPGACQHELPDRSLLGSTASSNSTQSSEGERPAL